jgi:hypothetical protein
LSLLLLLVCALAAPSRQQRPLTSNKAKHAVEILLPRAKRKTLGKDCFAESQPASSRQINFNFICYI